MRVKIKTKSNFRGLNGKWLDVKEAVGTRVSCVVETEEYGKQTVDFNIKEIVELAFADMIM